MASIDNIKWLGHASFMFTDITTDKKKPRTYYVDPFKLKGENYTKADIVFITHAHYDHCDPSSVIRLLKPETVIVAPDGCREKLSGIKAKFFDVVPNQEYEIGEFEFRTVPAYNTHPKRLEFHACGNEWVGYVFSLNSKQIYHPGDTDLIPEMSQLGKVHVAFLPLGGTYTMDVDEAIIAANTIRADITVPMHFRGLLKGESLVAEKKFEAGVRQGKVVVLNEEG
jgi:L-ascorbate metabolism protein UlaG (beta-lactamase superfamily)